MDTLSTEMLGRVFAEEIGAAGGRVKDVFDDGRRLFMRSVLPRVCEARPGDRLQGGVALRYMGEVVISPYVFREVCKNGAIWAHSLESARVAVGSASAEEDVREAVRACCAAEVFEASMGEVRGSLERRVDHALMMLSHYSRLGAAMNPRVTAEILDMYVEAGERTAYGLMNAVTAVARDVEDPELRWDLEACGGGIPALLTTWRTLEGGAARRLKETWEPRILRDEEWSNPEVGTRDLAAVA